LFLTPGGGGPRLFVIIDERAAVIFCVFCCLASARPSIFESIARRLDEVLMPPFEWQTKNRYMNVEAFDQIDKEENDTNLSITAKAA
jgi:hypothetical protein